MNRYGGAILNFLFNEIITHIPVHVLRKAFLRLFNKNIASNCVILMHTKIPCFWNLQMGANSMVNQYCFLDCRRYKVVIKANVDIGPYTRIWTLGHNPHDSEHALYGGDVVIEDHVWIASGVTILPNVHLKKGAVVGAASTVHKNVEEKQIVAGNPASFLKMRSNKLTYKIKYKPFLE
ncbi:MAG: acyltransferase [Winogradskyella sp.]|nr:acyltransferase [Winogradskyella sp.]